MLRSRPEDRSRTTVYLETTAPSLGRESLTEVQRRASTFDGRDISGVEQMQPR
jgi:hypothetical protein